jgi:hypothetical protein
MSYAHRIWTTTTPALQRAIQFTLVALLAFAVGAATVAYSGTITSLFAGADTASEQLPIPMRPDAPVVTLPRSEASHPNAYWDSFRPQAPAVALPQSEASHPNDYWDYVQPASSSPPSTHRQQP